MNRLVPFPLVSASIFALWLLLNQSVSLGHILLGGTIALIGGWALAALEPPKARPRRLRVIIHLAVLVLSDIVRSNIAVGSIILGLDRSRHSSGFLNIPLELRDSYGLAVLACIITSTPGTVWVKFDEASGSLTIHVLDLTDESEWIRAIQERYERPLREIFE